METGAIEFQGMLFTHKDDVVEVIDLNYSIIVGTLKLEEGPGWILTSFQSSFLDYGELSGIAKFIEEYLLDDTSDNHRVNLDETTCVHGLTIGPGRFACKEGNVIEG